MIKITESAFEEIISLASKGFRIEETISADGEPMIIAEKNGYIRQFLYERC